MTRTVSIAARLTLSLVCLGFAMSSVFSQAANQQPLSVRPRPFIAGGTAANIQDYPWQVAILNNQFHEPLRAQTCGGSIIYDRWVLTAAHCVTVTNGNAAVPPNQIDIVVGTATFATGGQRISIDRIVVHPQWNRTTGANDIALLHTSSLLQGANVLAVDLADSTTPIGGDLVVSGWGATSVGNQGTAVLQRVTVPYVSNATCDAAYHGAITITTGMMCAGFQGGGKGACHGDSGGPLVIYGNGPRRANGSGPFAIQVGIVSWSQPNTCAAPNAYMVYTRVSEYRSWISNTTAEVVALIRQDFSDCSNGNVSGGNPAQIGGSVAITRKPNGSINAQVSLTHGTANTSYHFFLKCVHILGDVHTNGQGSGSASFDFPSNLVGNQFAFDMYPEGAPLGNKYQSVRVTLH
jgi:secreted trypsin-like serine protease